MAISTNSIGGGLYSPYTSNKPTEAKKEEKTKETNESESTRKPGDYGKQIGNAKLSEAGAKYYEQLKKQFGNMDFILVSRDKKESAQANAAAYANPNKTVVLIDEDKIERMAQDENYRKQYEGIIREAASGISQLKSQLEQSGQAKNVSAFGIQIDDGGMASFFAVLEKSSKEQRERIEKRSEEKKEAKKEEERLEKKREAKRQQDAKLEKGKGKDPTEKVTISGDSIEDLLQKIADYNFNYMSDTIESDAEKLIGHSVDYRG